MFGLDNLIDMLFETTMESINRNERVIQLLKRLNLNPDHPPADFTGVYQYALVEYGMGKPRPVLEIFRQTKIQSLFREALEHNTPSSLLKNGEDFLADHPLQVDLQANNIDVRREFYAFAAVFIEVAKRTRTPAEILAEQKLESLHRQIGSLQERLNRLPTIEGMRTEMARLAAQDYPALAGSAIAPETFSAERCKAFALAQRMRGWFETLGYRFETHEVWDADYFEWIINVSVWRSRYIRILVRGVDGEVGLADVSALRQSVETYKTDEGWLVTARRIARAARDDVAKPENEHLGCYTLDELLDQDADFSGYLSWLEQEIQQRGIDQTYVPLACIKEEVDPVTRQRIGVSRYCDRDGWIDGYIDLWLDDPAKEHISVLGEFGTGKTWFAFHYAWKALQRYREAQQRGLERPRLPLVVPLRDYAKAVSVESLFSEFFFRKHEIPIPGYSAFEQLNRMGKLLLIFDGFDEMAARVDRQQMINNFWELAKVVVPGAKVILTCRTEHFPEAKEGRALLNAELQASTKDLTGETPQFEVLELEKFNDEQIRDVLSHQAQPATVEQIMDNPELLDLARRPVLTELILEALPDIEAGKPVDMSRVYLYAVRHKMERDIKAERTFTSMADKLYFMCELSWEMLSTDRMSINYREFPDRIRKLFGPAVEEQKDLDHWHYDMMGQTMLVRNAEGDYAPAHRSLLEFFVAYKFAAELGILAEDFVDLASQNTITRKDLTAANYTWTNYFASNLGASAQETPKHLLGKFTLEKADKLKATFGKSQLTKAILDLFIPIIENSPLTQSSLIDLIRETRKYPEDTDFLGGNAATVALSLDRAALQGQDLSSTIIQNTDFSHALLDGTNFSYADLIGSNFPKILGSVYSVSSSSDGHLFASGDSNGDICIWRFKEGNLYLKISGHSNAIRCVSFSPDGKTISSASEDKTVKIWNVHTGELVRLIDEHDSWVFSVVYSSNGKLLATASGDESVKIWDFETGQCMNTLTGHSSGVESITFISSDQKIISAGADKVIKIWNVQTGECLQTLEGHSERIRTIALEPDEKILISSGEDSIIRIWDLRSGTCLRTIEEGGFTIRSIAISPNSSIFASAGEDDLIKIWNLQTGEHIKNLTGHQTWVRTVAFHQNEKTLISGGGDRAIRTWNIETEECTKKFQGWTDEISSVSMSKDMFVAASSTDGSVKVLDIKQNRITKALALTGHTDKVYCVLFSPDNKILASGSRDRKIQLWDYQTGKSIGVLKGHSDRVRSISFSKDSRILVSGGSDNSLKVWDLRTQRCIQSFDQKQAIYSVDFIPNSNFVASAGEGCSVKLWDISRSCLVKEFSSNNRRLNVIAASPNGKFIAGAGKGWNIEIWDIETGERLSDLQGHSSWIDGLMFGVNSDIVISSSGDWTIRVWEVKTGNCLKVLNDHRGWVESIDISSDGRYLVSSSHDRTVKFWDLNTATCIHSMDFDKPYKGLNISGVKGLSSELIEDLKKLGASTGKMT